MYPESYIPRKFPNEFRVRYTCTHKKIFIEMYNVFLFQWHLENL